MIDTRYRSQRNWGARIHQVALHGMLLVVLENQHLRIGVLAGKGTDIVELNYKPRDLDFVWLTPGGVRNPSDFAVTAPDAYASFRDNYPGGWQEIFPSGSDPSSWQGANYGQHGELFNAPWDASIVEDSEVRVAVRFTIRTRRSPFLLEKTVSLAANSAEFDIEERLVNESPVETHAMWGHHITFGPPFLKPGHRLRLPEGLTATPHPEPIAPGGRRTSGTERFDWPFDPGNNADFSIIPQRGTPSEQLYLTGFPDEAAWYEITDPAAGVGARVSWDARVMPQLWFWQEFGASTAYPWYGRGYNVGLEPFAGIPNRGLAAAVENGTALRLDPHAVRTFSLKFSILGQDAGP